MKFLEVALENYKKKIDNIDNVIEQGLIANNREILVQLTSSLASYGATNSQHKKTLTNFLPLMQHKETLH